MLDELKIKAKPKEITLIINIINKIYNFEKDWTEIKFNGTCIMVPKGYFKNAEIQRNRVE